MNARAQDVVLASENLTQKQEDFARYYVECRNATTAYRLAYDVDTHGKPPTWLYTEASRQLAHPLIAHRIQTLQDEAAAHTIVKARELVQDWVDMASTDANELVQLHTNNCRHCYGEGFRYQWTDESELADATLEVQERIDAGVKAVKYPDVRGGFGYVVRRSPNPDCIKCEGRGSVVVRFADTNKLSPRARKLYKGAKVTSQGTELQLHDQASIRVELAKVMGLYGKDVTLNPAAAAAPVPEDATEATAALAYQQMLG